jgi:hypothetical protein
VRISAGTSWGTGFAIAPHRVLTSLHAVGELAEGRLALHGNEVEITAKITDSDGDNDRVRFPACVCTLDDVADFDAELGWIVFDVDSETFAGLTIPPLAAAAPSHNSARWTTYGFPTADDDLGEATEGDLISTAAPLCVGATTHTVLKLFSRQIAPSSGQPATGFAGAPVMVDGHVLGLLYGAATEAGSTEGMLHAVPMTLLEQRLRLTLQGGGATVRSAPPPQPPPAPAGPHSERIPAVAEPIAQLRALLHGVQAQMEMLGRYQALHGVLQELELPFDAIERDRRRLGASPRPQDEVGAPLDSMHRLVERATGILDQERLADEFEGTRQRLADAVARLRAARDGDAGALQAAIGQVRRVLALDRSRASRQVRGAVKGLGLGDVLPPLRTALDKLPRDDKSDPALDDLPQAVTLLAGVHTRLEAMVREHEDWQDIDNHLRFFLAGGRALDDTRLSWPLVRTSLETILSPQDAADWARGIAAACAQLDDHLERRASPAACVASLRCLWRLCHHRLIDVHQHCLRASDKLQRVSRSLGALLSGQKAADG